MADIPITLTCADYARLAPLASGDVRPDGVALTLIRGPRDRMLQRALGDPSVSGGESSLAQHLLRIDKGDRSFIALPAFVQRAFIGRNLYVGAGAAATALLSRSGLRVGMYSWTATGSIWFRHFFRHLGAPIDSYRWWIGPTEADASFKRDPHLPASVNSPAAGRGLADMLIDGEIDLLMSPPRPLRYHPDAGPIAHLFSDVRAVEKDYFRQTGVFPPQHPIVLRRAVWEAAPFAARSLQAAFEAADERFRKAQREHPLSTPWLEMELDETEALMGEAFGAHGLEPNRRMLEIFAAEAHRSGLASQRVDVDEMFEEFRRS